MVVRLPAIVDNAFRRDDEIFKLRRICQLPILFVGFAILKIDKKLFVVFYTCSNRSIYSERRYP